MNPTNSNVCFIEKTDFKMYFLQVNSMHTYVSICKVTFVQTNDLLFYARITQNDGITLRRTTGSPNIGYVWNKIHKLVPSEKVGGSSYKHSSFNIFAFIPSGITYPKMKLIWGILKPCLKNTYKLFYFINYMG